MGQVAIPAMRDFVARSPEWATSTRTGCRGWTRVRRRAFRSAVAERLDLARDLRGRTQDLAEYTRCRTERQADHPPRRLGFGGHGQGLFKIDLLPFGNRSLNLDLVVLLCQRFQLFTQFGEAVRPPSQHGRAFPALPDRHPNFFEHSTCKAVLDHPQPDILLAQGSA